MSDKKRKSNGEEEVADNAKRSKKSPENGNAASATSKPKLSGKEHEDLKRFLRERKKFLTQRPNLELTAVGRAASIESPSSSVAIMASDVRLLLLYLMMGDKMQDKEIGWAHVQKWNNISNVVCLVVDGNIGAKDLQRALAEDSAPDSRAYATR